MKPLHRQRGTAALELVAVLVLSVGFMATIVLVGRLTLHAIATEKSIDNATRIIAAQTRETLTATAADVDILSRAKALVLDSLVSAGLDTIPRPTSILATCGTTICGTGVVQCDATLSVSYRFTDTLFGTALTGALLPLDGVVITSQNVQRCAPASLP